MPVRMILAVTDGDWFNQLRQMPNLAEVNFWSPSDSSFRALQPGELFLFKLHSPNNFVVGGGVFDLPDDMDERRILLTRHMAMYRNQWHGCPARLCRRNRGCMAPEGVCANAAQEVEMSEEEWAQARFEIRQALRERILELGMEDECGGL